MVGAPAQAATGLRLREVRKEARVKGAAPCGRDRETPALRRMRELQLCDAEGGRAAVVAPVMESDDALGTLLSAGAR